MQIENTFTVPVPVDEAWAVLLDVERVAPCMPGAALDSVDGDTFTGRVKVKVGPVNLTYKGRAEFRSRDEATRTAVIAGRGKDSRGNGTADAVVTMRLAAEDDHTRVDLTTDLDITGRPAQLGRSVMTDVGNRIIGQFASALATQMEEQPVAAAKPAPPQRQAAQEPEAINVLALAGRSTMRTLGAALLGLVRRLFSRQADRRR
ncbi:SRPBCC family protein [Kribbella sp. NPDC050241]|uniref:SRPBCC family protein n=1 Tax=Kribbella sp. NPDC050241 TaxID=3364115 RepID=UPI003787BA7C